MQTNSQLDIPRYLYYRLLFKSKEHQEQALLEYSEEEKNKKGEIISGNSSLTNKNIICNM
jgi:hypothetical protein